MNKNSEERKIRAGCEKLIVAPGACSTAPATCSSAPCCNASPRSCSTRSTWASRTSSNACPTALLSPRQGGAVHIHHPGAREQYAQARPATALHGSRVAPALRRLRAECTTSQLQFKAIVFARIVAFTLLLRRAAAGIVFHSRVSQARRTAVTNAFRDALSGMLVAREMDFPNMTTAIQADIPVAKESCIHRLRRTARGALRCTARIIRPYLHAQRDRVR